MTTPDKLRIRYEHEDGWWTVNSPDVPSLATQGRTLDQARERAREALSTVWDDWPRAERAEFLEEIG